MALWTARTATLPLASTGPEPATVPVLAAMTAAVVQQAAPEHRFATAAATLCISALVLGACWVLMGHLRLGSLVRLVPYPVIGGFLAAVGWLMFRGGVGVASVRRPCCWRTSAWKGCSTPKATWMSICGSTAGPTC
ncbi:MAG: SulP family inorganic anion transporter [Burkholderiaceae bacterium]